MQSTPDSWEWIIKAQYPSYCLTFTKGITARAVHERYGADYQNTRSLSQRDAQAVPGNDKDNSMLRVGKMGEWAFCFETGGVQGITPHVLSSLSQGTEALCLAYGADGTLFFRHWRNGHRVESFEPGIPYSVRSSDSHTLWGLVQHHIDAHPERVPGQAALSAVSDYIGGHVISSAMVEGPLLTSFIPPRPPERHPPGSLAPESRAQLGHLLGSYSPSDLTSQPRNAEE